MSKVNKQSIVASVQSLYNSAKKTGYLDLNFINILYVYDYYLDFTKKSSKYNKKHRLLLDSIYNLKNSINDICNYKSVIPNMEIYREEIINSRPILSELINVTVDNVSDLNGVNFNTSLIIKDNYSDPDNDDLRSILVYVNGNERGSIEFNGEEVLNNIEVNASDFNKLVYIPEEDTYDINIPIRVSDKNANSLYSIIYNYTFNVNLTNVINNNQPPTVGDITIYPENREITTLTLSMFTSQLTPPYNDPENDLIDAIRIDEISTANQGKFYYNNVEIQEGVIITREDLELGLFEHRGANVDDITSDVINFSARDEGSLKWVN